MSLAKDSAWGEAGTRALRKWYNEGAAGAIDWGHDGDWATCVSIAGKYISDPEGYCQLRHIDATGAPTAHAPAELAERAAEGKKSLPSVIAAGVAIRAKDTGRVLLQQRGYDDTDPASGKFEWPGGHIEGDESPAEAAVREWREETGVELPDGEMIADWVCPMNTFQTFLWEIPSESDIHINLDDADRVTTNPDDPDCDKVETLAWFEVKDLPGNSILRDVMQQIPWHTLATGATPVSPATKSKKTKKKTKTAIVASTGQLVLSKPVQPGDKIIVEHKDGNDDEYGVEDYDDLGKAKASHDEASHRITLYEELHERITQYYAPHIAQAMRNVTGIRESIEQARQVWPQYTKAAGDDENPIHDATPVTTEGFSESPQLGPIGHDIALTAIESNIKFDPEGIKNTLQDLYNDAATAGIGIGNLQLSAIASWKPGNPSASDLVANGALRQILAELDITIKGLTDSAVDRMGNILAEGLNQGLSPVQIAKNMSDIIADPKRALVIARTETARAQGISTLVALKTAGNAQWMWHANIPGACPKCIYNEDNSPYPIDGGPAFPGHPNCRCQPLPYVDLS